MNYKEIESRYSDHDVGLEAGGANEGDQAQLTSSRSPQKKKKKKSGLDAADFVQEADDMTSNIRKLSSASSSDVTNANHAVSTASHAAPSSPSVVAAPENFCSSFTFKPKRVADLSLPAATPTPPHSFPTTPHSPHHVSTVPQPTPHSPHHVSTVPLPPHVHGNPTHPPPHILPVPTYAPPHNRSTPPTLPHHVLPPALAPPFRLPIPPHALPHALLNTPHMLPKCVPTPTHTPRINDAIKPLAPVNTGAAPLAAGAQSREDGDASDDEPLADISHLISFLTKD